MSTIPIVHEDGLVFIKCQGETGITYKSLDVQELDVLDRAYLVRHGSPDSGRCGYYPVWLVLAPQAVRVEKAHEARKRPPSLEWVQRTRQVLAESGIPFITH